MFSFILNGVIAGSLIALVGSGFALIYGTARFFHLGHGAAVVVGGYCHYCLYVLARWNFGPSLFFSMLCSALLGILMEEVVYRPLRKRGAPSMVLFISSLGILQVVQSGVALLFSDEVKLLRRGAITPGYEILGASITGNQILTICMSVAIGVGLELMQKKTSLGKFIKATADDPRLAEIAGINTDRILLITAVLGSALGGLAGVFVGFETNINPAMGMNSILLAIIAALIGTGRIWGTMASAYGLGIVQQLGVFQLGAQWKNSIAMSILILFLLGKWIIQRNGLFQKPRKVTSSSPLN